MTWYGDPRPHGMGMCGSHFLVPVSLRFSKSHLTLRGSPPLHPVKAIGAIASHQLWSIGAVALPQLPTHGLGSNGEISLITLVIRHQ